MGLIGLEPGIVLHHPKKGIGIYLGKHLIFSTVYKYNQNGVIKYTTALVDELLSNPAWMGYSKCLYYGVTSIEELKLQTDLNTYFKQHEYMKGKCLLGEYECVAWIVYPSSPAQEIVYKIDMVKSLKRSDFDELLAVSEAQYRIRRGLANADTAMELFLHSELLKSSHFSRGLDLVTAGLKQYHIMNCYNIIETEYGVYPILHGERVTLKYYNLNFRNRIKFPVPDDSIGSFILLQI